MSRIRLLIAAMPPMLNDIVRTLSTADPAVELVAEVESGARLENAATAVRPDVIVMPAMDGTAALEKRLLLALPQVRLLTIAEDGHAAYVHRLVSERTAIPDVSPRELLQAILGTTRYGGSGVTCAGP